MGAVSSVVDAVGSVVGGAVDAVGNAVGSVIDAAVSNPLATAATIATAIVAPEFLPAVAETGGTATGLATLPNSVATAAEAFGAPASASLIAPEVAAMQAASAPLTSASIGDVFANTPSVLDTTTPVSTQPTADLGSGGFNPIDTTNTAGLSSADLAGTGGTNMTAINAANAAGASASNTDLASQLMSGSGTPPTSSTSWYDTAKNLGNLLSGGTQSGTNSLLTGLSGVNVGATQIPVSKQAPFHYTNAQPTTTPSAPSSPTFLSGSQPQLLAALLNKKA